jgi:transcriptional regulator with XRE-family HTH domain
MALRKRVPAASLRLDAGRLYEALDNERKQREMSLEEVAAELCLSYSTMACWRRGGGLNGDALLRLAVWMPITDLRAYARQLPPADPLPAVQTEAA